MSPKERLEQITQEISKLESERRAICEKSLEASEEEKACHDWISEMYLEDHGDKKPIMGEIKYIVSDDNGERAFQNVMKPGMWVRVRPCSEKGANETFLGIYIGHIATSFRVRFNKEHSVLGVSFAGHNPAIMIPSLNRVVFGYESWWSILKSPEDLKQITNEEIDSVWYVQALKKLSEPEKNNA